MEHKTQMCEPSRNGEKWRACSKWDPPQMGNYLVFTLCQHIHNIMFS